MHDCLEGSIQYEVKELLRHLFQSNLISLSGFNDIMEAFPYKGPDLRNKPTLISASSMSSSDHALKQTGTVLFSILCVVNYFFNYLATQMWCFSRLLPLMIGEKVPHEDDHWKNFLLLLIIQDYVFAPSISPQSILYLKGLINDHHQSFKELYPTCSIIPKMHYMVHYPECIERYSNISFSWWI